MKQVKKIEIALIQLRTAIQLFKKGNYISAITVAGAAEEILGEIALKRKGTNALMADKAFLDEIADHLKKPRPGLKNVVNQRNKVKNELKHNKTGNDYTIQHDFKYEAEELILAAVNNYAIIFRKYPKDRVIREYALSWL